MKSQNNILYHALVIAASIILLLDTDIQATTTRIVLAPPLINGACNQGAINLRTEQSLANSWWNLTDNSDCSQFDIKNDGSEVCCKLLFEPCLDKPNSKHMCMPTMKNPPDYAVVKNPCTKGAIATDGVTLGAGYYPTIRNACEKSPQGWDGICCKTDCDETLYHLREVGQKLQAVFNKSRDACVKKCSAMLDDSDQGFSYLRSAADDFYHTIREECEKCNNNEVDTAIPLPAEQKAQCDSLNLASAWQSALPEIQQFLITGKEYKTDQAIIDYFDLYTEAINTIESMNKLQNNIKSLRTCAQLGAQVADGVLCCEGIPVGDPTKKCLHDLDKECSTTNQCLLDITRDTLKNICLNLANRHDLQGIMKGTPDPTRKDWNILGDNQRVTGSTLGSEIYHCPQPDGSTAVSMACNSAVINESPFGNSYGNKNLWLSAKTLYDYTKNSLADAQIHVGDLCASFPKTNYPYCASKVIETCFDKKATCPQALEQQFYSIKDKIFDLQKTCNYLRSDSKLQETLRKTAGTRGKILLYDNETITSSLADDTSYLVCNEVANHPALSGKCNFTTNTGRSGAVWISRSACINEQTGALTEDTFHFGKWCISNSIKTHEYTLT